MFIFFLYLPTCLSSYKMTYSICFESSSLLWLLENQVVFVLFHLGCCGKYTMNWATYKLETFISHSPGSWECNHNHGACSFGVWLELASGSEMMLLPVSSQDGRGRGSLIRSPISFMRALQLPSWPKQTLHPLIPSPWGWNFSVWFQGYLKKHSAHSTSDIFEVGKKQSLSFQQP